MNEKMNRWLSKTRLNNAIDSHVFGFTATKKPVKCESENQTVEKRTQPRPNCMEALGTSHSATMIYICDTLKMQVSKKSSGCRCPTFRTEGVSSHCAGRLRVALKRSVLFESYPLKIVFERRRCTLHIGHTSVCVSIGIYLLTEEVLR